MKVNSRPVPFIVVMACCLFSLIAIVYVAIAGKEILAPFIFAILFSLLLLPVAKFFEKKCRFSRGIASLLAIIVLVVSIAGVGYFLGAELARLGDDWPQFKAQLDSSSEDLKTWVSHTFHITATKQKHMMNDATSNIVGTGTAIAGQTLLSLSSILLSLIFTYIFSFFFLLYRNLILRFLVHVFQGRNQEIVHDIIEQVQFIIRKYIIGLLLEMLIVAGFISLVFTLLGVKYALLLGVMTGILNLIPYLGIFTGLAISALITFATATSASSVIWVALTIFGTHVVDSNVLLPVIVGSKVKINAMITVMGVVIGELIWGIPGMFLSIPVIAVLKIIFDRVEAMKPWGLLLGEDDPKTEPLIDRLEGDPPSLEKKMVDEPE